MAELIAEISKLSLAERLKLVQAILQTIETDTLDLPDFQLTEKQISEAERRSSEITNGTVKTISWESVQAKITERYGVSN